MRIKWNRHLDGSSSRQEEGSEAPEKDEKKHGASSPPSIFRIFRRKKNKRRENDEKTGENDAVPPLPSEADDDECASVSSLATCSSQPASEGFHRDRASSLFSSFRLSLPGSKRKKRRIAPAPSDTLLNGQQNEPQPERYSTPDLRKTSDKLPLPNNSQINLSTSSPSIRSPKGTSAIAQFLDPHNSESLDKLKWTPKSTTPNSKLSKSVSFSNCRKDLIDSLHSTCDNKALRSVNSVAMVEKDSAALESELPACLSDNLRMSCESKLTSFEDSSGFKAKESNRHNQSSHDVDDTAQMTKTKVADTCTGVIGENSISNIDNILSDIVSEIRNYEKPTIEVDNNKDSLHQCLATPQYYDSRTSQNDQGDVAIAAGVQEMVNNKGYAVRVNSATSPEVLHVHSVSSVSPVSEWNTFSKIYDSSDCDIVLPNEGIESISYLNVSDKSKSAEVPFCDNLQSCPTNNLSKFDVVTPTKVSSRVKTYETTQNPERNADDLACNINENGITKCDYKPSKMQIDSEKCTPDVNSKHVMCHMRVCQNRDEILSHKLDDSDLINVQSFSPKHSSTENLSGNFAEKIDLLKNNCANLFNINGHHKDSAGLNSIQSVPSLNSSLISENSYRFYAPDNNSSNSNSSILNENDCDQEVPSLSFHKYSLKEHEVPEFELSILEFEEVCDRYMSPNLPLSDYSSIIPHYDSPKRKSVLNFPITYQHFHRKDDSKTHLNHTEEKNITVTSGHIDGVIQNAKTCGDLNLPDSCQNVTENNSFPLPPKQWTNYQKPIANECGGDVCTGRVQRTGVRGKNLCQKPCLEALPTTVMHGDSDLGGIDTPQQSSTLLVSENNSGRDCSSIDAALQQQLPDDQTPPEDMISNLGINIPALNGVLDYSYISETPNKSSVYLDPEIRDSYRGQRAICGPLVYCADRTKRLESLGTENYLSSHNFSDIRSVGLSEIISDISCDYVQSSSGLIDISNPYQEDAVLIPDEISDRNFMSGVGVCAPSDISSDSSEVHDAGFDQSSPGEDVLKGSNDADLKSKTREEKEVPLKSNCDAKYYVEQSITVKDVDKCRNYENKSNNVITNGNGYLKESGFDHTEQKNLINKSKISMIPCRKKGQHDFETKRIETKTKTKKAKTIPRFKKDESILSIKNNGSLRVLSSSNKDSDAEQLRGKFKDDTTVKCNGNHPDISLEICSSSETSEISNKTNGLSSYSEATICQDSGYAAESARSKDALEFIPLDYSDSAVNFDKSESSSITIDLDASVSERNGQEDLESVSSLLFTSDNTTNRDSQIMDIVADAPPIVDVLKNNDKCSVPETDTKIAKEFYSELPLDLNNEKHEIPSEFSESVDYQNELNVLESIQRSRCSSLPAVGLIKKSYTSSKESLNSQLTNSSNRGKSRIPRKQPGTRGAQTSKGPFRPPMWLSKAELTQEIQRLGTLCEARTKELNRLKMETKHVSVGFDAFAALFKYMVEDPTTLAGKPVLQLNGLSVPTLIKDLEKTLKQLELTKQDLAYYEREVEEMKSHHCQELNDLSNKLFEVYQSEVAELNVKHQDELNLLKSDHQKQMELLTATFDTSSSEAKAHQEKLVASLEQETIKQREELQLFHEREIKDIEEKHKESTKLLHDHTEQLQKKCAELKQHCMSMEDAMRKDTDSKLQWVSAAKLDLEKEVESLKTVLEMKNKELHKIRVQNLEMTKQLEELPYARDKIKTLQARAEDLEALMIEKTKLERKLSNENQQIKDTYEKETKVNRRLSMENEELQWRLRQAENSLISGSFTEVPEFPEEIENPAASPTKSPAPQMMSRSVFFTFVDKDESTPHSPRTQYKKITPGFSSSYKTSPAKSSKSPPGPSPRRAKSHSEPPQPILMTSTPRKNSKPSSKSKGPQKRQRSGSDSGRPVGEHTDVNFSSVAESMTSSVSSESSVFEHRERLLDEHKEHIIHSLEILREQRSTEGSTADEPTVIEKKWCSDDIKVTGQLSKIETEDMSRSAEFADPKTYYHMTFPVLKESGITDCDMEDGSKNSSNGSSPVKEVMSKTKHSMSENNINSSIDKHPHTIQAMSVSFQEVNTTIIVDSNINTCSELTVSAENVQKEASSGNVAENRWRTI